MKKAALLLGFMICGSFAMAPIQEDKVRFFSGHCPIADNIHNLAISFLNR